MITFKPFFRFGFILGMVFLLHSCGRQIYVPTSPQFQPSPTATLAFGTATSTATLTAATSTPTNTHTIIPVGTATFSPTPTLASSTLTPTSSHTKTFVFTNTFSPTPMVGTPTSSATNSATATWTKTSTPTNTRTLTRTAIFTFTFTGTPTPTWTGTWNTFTPTITNTPTLTLTPTLTVTLTFTGTWYSPTPTPTLTPLCNPWASFGNTLSQTASLGASGTLLVAGQVTLSEPATLFSLSVHLQGSGPVTLSMAIYAEAGGAPSTMITQSGPLNVMSGQWCTLMVPATYLTPGNYWIATLAKGFSPNVNLYNVLSPSPTLYSLYPAPGALPDPLPPQTLQKYTLEVYGSYCPDTAYNASPVPTFTNSFTPTNSLTPTPTVPTNTPTPTFSPTNTPTGTLTPSATFTVTPTVT